MGEFGNEEQREMGKNTTLVTQCFQTLQHFFILTKGGLSKSDLHGNHSRTHQIHHKKQSKGNGGEPT